MYHSLYKNKNPTGHMEDTEPTLPKEKQKKKWFSFFKKNKT